MARSTLRELGGLLMTLALVMSATAALLRVVDALPPYLGGAPRGIERFDSVEALERRLGARVLLPAYFPDRLRWPPTAIRLRPGPAPSVVLTFAERGGDAALVIVEVLGASGSAPPEPVTAGGVLHAVTVPLHGAPATLRRIIDADGRLWHELGWIIGERRVVLRWRGPVEELIRMAESMRSRG